MDGSLDLAVVGGTNEVTLAETYIRSLNYLPFISQNASCDTVCNYIKGRKKTRAFHRLEDPFAWASQQWSSVSLPTCIMKT